MYILVISSFRIIYYTSLFTLRYLLRKSHLHPIFPGGLPSYREEREDVTSHTNGHERKYQGQQIFLQYTFFYILQLIDIYILYIAPFTLLLIELNIMGGFPVKGI